jgi:dipeptidyl aminopeptidase/acylaminoacyl peptidase
MQVTFNNKIITYPAIHNNSNFPSMPIDPDSLTMSQDGKHLAYEENTDNKTFWVIDGKEYREFLTYLDINRYTNPSIEPSNLIFSPDGKKFAFTTAGTGSSHNSPRQIVVENGIPGNTYEEIVKLQYSNDSNTLVYLARNGNNLYLVKNNVAIPDGVISLSPYNQISNLYMFTVSPNGQNIIYNLGNTVVLNGAIVASYDGVSNTATFSPDGKYVGYGVEKSSQLWWIVKDLSK